MLEKDFCGNFQSEKLTRSDPKKRADSLEIGLKKYDTTSFNERLERLRFIAQVMSNADGYFLFSRECVYLFEDLKNCFIFGQFAACILLCQSIIEHHIVGLYRNAGKDNTSRLPFKNLTEQALIDGIIHEPFIVAQLEELRKRRNPLVHASEKPLGTYDNRALKSGIKQELLLQKDAEEAMQLTFDLLKRYKF